MTGYFPLGNLIYPYLFTNKPSRLGYSFEKRGDVVIVHNSIPVKSLNHFLNYLEENNLTNKHVLFGVEGQGATEQHIVTMHLPPNGVPKIYDSKYSNPKRFFASNRSKNTVIGILGAAFHSLNPWASKELNVDLNHISSKRIPSATYYSLGTQSFFDGITCGYHTGSLIEILADRLNSNFDPSPQNLLDALKNPVTDAAAKLQTQNAPKTLDMSIFSFWKKAWQDTFLPLIDTQVRDNYHFGHYFLGWPSDPKGSKLAYFITLKFITAPLTNLLSFFTEFPLNFLSETFSFLKNITLSWAPTNWFTQSIRSALLLVTMGLEGLFKGAYYLTRTITSPITSFKEAQRVHPVLGFLSALASVCFIGAAVVALSFFAPPISAALMPSMGPGALTLLSNLAYPFVQLFSLISVSLPTASGAMLSLMTLISSVGILHRLGRQTIYPEESQPAKHNEITISVVPPVGSNVSTHLKRTGTPSVKDEWVDVDPNNSFNPRNTTRAVQKNNPSVENEWVDVGQTLSNK
ncbi:hypothetical protein [Legionella sp. WA2024007413]